MTKSKKTDASSKATKSTDDLATELQTEAEVAAAAEFERDNPSNPIAEADDAPTGSDADQEASATEDAVADEALETAELEQSADDHEAADDPLERASEEETPLELEPDSSAAAPQTEPAAAPVPASGSRSGFAAGVLGGVLAVGGALFAAPFLLPEGWPSSTAFGQLKSDVTEVDAWVTRLAGEAEDQSAKLGSVATQDDLAAVRSEIAAVRAADPTTGIRGEIQELAATLDARILELEKRPISGAETEEAVAAVEAYGREVAALRDEVAEKLQIIEALLAETQASAAAAEAEALAAAQQKALVDIQQALGTGDAFADKLAILAGREIPEGLSASSAEGVVTLETLIDTFPALAREALAVSAQKAEPDEGGSRVGSFLRKQLGVRSLAPREGDDPDAVLSRAEAALKAGNLSAAIETLAELPETGQVVLADWMTKASARQAALNGAQALTAAITGN